LVKGIGLKTVEKNRERIVFGAAVRPKASAKAVTKPAPQQVVRR
jgi:hypothetical protein